MGRHSHISSSPPAAAESTAAASRRSNPPRRARNAQSATAAQASALHSSSSTRSSRASAFTSPPTVESSDRGRQPSTAAGTRRSLRDSPAAVGGGSTASLRMVAASFSASVRGQGSNATGSPASSTSFGHSSSGAAIIPCAAAVSTPTESGQFEQEPITATGPRDDGMDSTQLSALVTALGPIPSGWSLSAGEPYHRFDKSAFAGAELPTTLDPDSRAKCLAFLQDPRVLRVTELEPSVEGLPRLSACVCPICGTLVKDNWVPSRSGGFRRQIRTESLKEHLGMRHHLLRRVKCPVQDVSGCNCRGYCKAHRLLNHFSDNIGCLVHIDQMLATQDAASTHVLSTMQWALGSDWPRAFDELANAAIVASGRPAAVDLDVQFTKCRELVLSRVAKARKVAVGVIEQAIQVHRHEQAPASVVGLWQSSAVGDAGQSCAATAAGSDVPMKSASPALQSRHEAPSRTSTLDSLLAVPPPSTAPSRSPLLIVTPAPSAAAADMLFDQFQLQPMSPTASDGASNWSQGTSVSASTGVPHDASMLPPMDLQQDALLGSLGMYSAAQSQFDFGFPQQHNNVPLSAPIGLDLPAAAPILPILPPGFVLPSALDTRTAAPQFMSPPHSNPHTPVHSPIHPPAPVMLEVPDWVQAHIPASVSPAGSPAASPYLFPTHSPHLMATLASPAHTTGLTPLMDQQLRFPGTSSPATSPSMHACAPFPGMYSPSLLASPAFLATSSSASQAAAISPVVSMAARQSPPAPHHQHQRARVMHFVPTPDNLLVDGVYIGPVGPSVATVAVSGGGSAPSGWPAASSAGMGFTTVADALDMRLGGGGGYYFRS